MLIAAGSAAPCGSSSDAGDYCVFKVTGFLPFPQCRAEVHYFLGFFILGSCASFATGQP